MTLTLCWAENKSLYAFRRSGVCFRCRISCRIFQADWILFKFEIPRVLLSFPQIFEEGHPYEICFNHLKEDASVFCALPVWQLCTLYTWTVYRWGNITVGGKTFFLIQLQKWIFELDLKFKSFSNFCFIDGTLILLKLNYDRNILNIIQSTVFKRVKNRRNRIVTIDITFMPKPH